MAILTIRPYAGEAVASAIADLVNTCYTFDQLNQSTSASEIQLILNAPEFDKKRDLRLWEDADGRLIGFGLLSMSKSKDVVDGYLRFHIHPTVRGEVESQIFKWSEQRLREVGKEPLCNLRTYSRDDQTNRMVLLEKQGFTIDRYFLTMGRSLNEPIGAPQFPTGFTLGHISSEQDIQPWVEMFNQSFIDHWNHHDLTVEAVRHWLSKPNYKPELNLIATALDGTFAAFCYCIINQEQNTRNGRNEGWIEFLGTRRGFRQMGLGRAMLLAGLQRLHFIGMDTVKLSVDAESPTGATRLYQSVGFLLVDTWISYVKEVSC